MRLSEGDGHVTGAMTSRGHVTSRRVVSSRVDYCDTETFAARCSGQGEVVMIERASYGRMRLGRCVETDMGHDGRTSSPHLCTGDAITTDTETESAAETKKKTAGQHYRCVEVHRRAETLLQVREDLLVVCVDPLHKILRSCRQSRSCLLYTSPSPRDS